MKKRASIFRVTDFPIYPEIRNNNNFFYTIRYKNFIIRNQISEHIISKRLQTASGEAIFFNIRKRKYISNFIVPKNTLATFFLPWRQY
jgi:hypothetical protein